MSHESIMSLLRFFYVLSVFVMVFFGSGLAAFNFFTKLKFSKKACYFFTAIVIALVFYSNIYDKIIVKLDNAVGYDNTSSEDTDTSDTVADSQDVSHESECITDEVSEPDDDISNSVADAESSNSTTRNEQPTIPAPIKTNTPDIPENTEPIYGTGVPQNTDSTGQENYNPNTISDNHESVSNIEQAPVTTSVDTTPIATTPIDITPVDTTPIDTTPIDITPVDTTPIATTPIDITPVDTTPVDTVPIDTTLTDTTPTVVRTWGGGLISEEVTVTYDTHQEIISQTVVVDYDPNPISVTCEVIDDNVVLPAI